jgi:hypothetical protein
LTRPPSRSWTLTLPPAIDELGSIDCWIHGYPQSQAFYLRNEPSQMSCHCCRLHRILDNSPPLAVWYFPPSSTWRTNTSNVLHHNMPNLLSLLLVVAETCWLASGTWQAACGFISPSSSSNPFSFNICSGCLYVGINSSFILSQFRRQQ